MKKIMVCLVSFAFALLPFTTAAAYSHANAYGGSTSHSYGSSHGAHNFSRTATPSQDTHHFASNMALPCSPCTLSMTR